MSPLLRMLVGVSCFVSLAVSSISAIAQKQIPGVRPELQGEASVPYPSFG
jgi:hypothetical protein